MAFTTPASVGGATARSVTAGLTKRRSNAKGKLVEALLIGTLALSLLVLLVLIVDLLRRSWPVWTDRPGDFLTTNLNSQSAALAGVGQAIRGTLILCAVVVVVAFPLGIACAVYLEEYAGRSAFARLTRVNVRNLAGVPSIVYGLLGLAIFVQALGGVTGGRTVFAGGLALSALVLPIVVITTAEAIRAVPRSLREGAYGVGATRWEVVRTQVLPYAAPGILTGCLLSIARAVGEAAPLIVVGAVTGFLSRGAGLSVSNVVDPGHLTERFVALPTIVSHWAKLPEEEFKVANSSAAILAMLAFVLLVNTLAIVLRNRVERKRST